MQINRNDLQYITSVQHQGLVFLFGIDRDRDIYYSDLAPVSSETVVQKYPII